MPWIKLSEKQQKAAAAAVTVLSILIILLAVAALAWLVGTFFSKFSNVFLPIAVAGVAALVFRPYYEWLRDRLKLPATVSLVAVFLSVALPLVLFVWFFGAQISAQVGDLVERLPQDSEGWRESWTEVAETVEARWPPVRKFFDEDPLGVRLKEAFEEQEETLLEGVKTFGSRIFATGIGVLKGAAGLLGWAVLPVYFAFFLMATPGRFSSLESHLPFLKRETREDVVYLVQEFVNIIVAFFRGQLIIAFLQGLLFAIGFSLVGLRYGFIIGLLLGFLNIVPYLGNIVGLGVALPLAFFQSGGGLGKIVWVLGVFAMVQMIEGYLLTPKIMGDRTGLHPMVIIVAIFFWGSALNGISGMILAIPLTAFLVIFWRLAQEKYLDEWV